MSSPTRKRGPQERAGFLVAGECGRRASGVVKIRGPGWVDGTSTAWGLMAWVRDVHVSEHKCRVVRSICKLCEDELGVRVICEGVEVSGEREALVNCGAGLLQGYFFGKPQAEFWRPDEP